MRVFVDTCVYNDFLQARGGSLEVLRKFKKSLEQGKFKLVFPKITQDEIYRGVPQEFKWKLVLFDMPPVPAGLEETEIYKETAKLLEKLNTNLEKIEKEKQSIIQKIMTDYIEKFVSQAEVIEEDDKIIAAAQVRRLKRNPPGKNEYLGDELVWELLLNKCTDDDLVIISHDIDWRYGEKKLHPFLEREWKEKSTKKIELFLSLKAFLQEKEHILATKKTTETTTTTTTSLRKTLPLTYAVRPPPEGTAAPFGTTLRASLASVSPLATGAMPDPATVSGTLSITDIVFCNNCGNSYLKPPVQITLSGATRCPYCGEMNL